MNQPVHKCQIVDDTGNKADIEIDLSDMGGDQDTAQCGRGRSDDKGHGDDAIPIHTHQQRPPDPLERSRLGADAVLTDGEDRPLEKRGSDDLVEDDQGDQGEGAWAGSPRSGRLAEQSRVTLPRPRAVF